MLGTIVLLRQLADKAPRTCKERTVPPVTSAPSAANVGDTREIVKGGGRGGQEEEEEEEEEEGLEESLFTDPLLKRD